MRREPRVPGKVDIAANARIEQARDGERALRVNGLTVEAQSKRQPPLAFGLQIRVCARASAIDSATDDEQLLASGWERTRSRCGRTLRTAQRHWRQSR